MTIRVHALEYIEDLRPDGGGYAPQVVLIRNLHGTGWGWSELNADYLPFTAATVAEVWDRFRNEWPDRHLPYYPRAEAAMARYFRIFYGVEMHHKITRGFSQSDWGHSFVFATPEWLEVTGAPGVRESDHNDFCAWLWGDVYEVFNDDPEDLNPKCPGGDIRWPMTLPDGTEVQGVISAVTEEYPMTVYGMDEAMKYGDITYPTHRMITTYEY